MTRVDDFLELVDNPARQALTPGHPADDALIALLVHTAFSDGDVDDEELDFLQKVLPGRDRADLANWARQVGAQPLKIDAIAAALPTADERWKGLRFAARMAWKDGEVHSQERELLANLARGLDLSVSAVEQVLSEMHGQAGGQVAHERLVEVLKSITWNSVQMLEDPVTGPLAEVSPPGARPARSIALDDVVVMALYADGVAAYFLEGTTFIGWSELITYTRVPTFGAAIQLHTEDGRTWTLVDARLRGLVVVLDRLFGAERKARGTKPVVEQLRGETDE
jgi:hypothetical protein